MLVDALSDKGMAVLKGKIGEIDGAAQRLEKVASLPIDDRNDLTKEAFAWPEEKLFPIYSPAHALVSSVYLEGNDDVPGFVKEACEEACALFGMDVQIGSLEKTATEPEQLDASDFLLPAQRKLPVVDKDTFRMSASALEKVASDLSPDDLVVANRQLVKKASEFGSEVSDYNLSLGLYGTVDTASARSILFDRKLSTGDNRYEKIASDMTGNTIYSVEKVASLVFDVLSLDKDNNLDKTAEEAILELVHPGAVEDVYTIGDEEIPTDKIASIDAEAWTDIFARPLVESMFSDGSLDFDMLKEVTDSASPEEKEAIAMFVATN
jgi:hypothetical protein